MTGTRERTVLDGMIAMVVRFQRDMAQTATRERHLPQVLRNVWESRSSRKRKISLYVDEDTYRLFRSMGPRIKRILTSFDRARLAGLLEGEDLLESYRERWMGKPKPSVAKALAHIEGR